MEPSSSDQRAKRVDRVYEKTLTMIEDDKIDKTDYMSLVVSVMQLVEHYTGAKRDEKSNIVVDVVMKLTNHIDDPAMKSILSETTVRNLIKVSVDLFKGKYDLGKRWTKIKSSVGKLCCGGGNKDGSD